MNLAKKNEISSNVSIFDLDSAMAVENLFN